jgi:hypothetical protein
MGMTLEERVDILEKEILGLFDILERLWAIQKELVYKEAGSVPKDIYV